MRSTVLTVLVSCTSVLAGDLDALGIPPDGFGSVHGEPEFAGAGYEQKAVFDEEMIGVNADGTIFFSGGQAYADDLESSTTCLPHETFGLSCSNPKGNTKVKLSLGSVNSDVTALATQDLEFTRSDSPVDSGGVGEQEPQSIIYIVAIENHSSYLRTFRLVNGRDMGSYDGVKARLDSANSVVCIGSNGEVLYKPCSDLRFYQFEADNVKYRVESKVLPPSLYKKRTDFDSSSSRAAKAEKEFRDRGVNGLDKGLEDLAGDSQISTDQVPLTDSAYSSRQQSKVVEEESGHKVLPPVKHDQIRSIRSKIKKPLPAEFKEKKKVLSRLKEKINHEKPWDAHSEKSHFHGSLDLADFLLKSELADVKQERVDNLIGRLKKKKRPMHHGTRFDSLGDEMLELEQSLKVLEEQYRSDRPHSRRYHEKRSHF